MVDPTSTTENEEAEEGDAPSQEVTGTISPSGNARYNRAALDWLELRIRRLSERAEGGIGFQTAQPISDLPPPVEPIVLPELPPTSVAPPKRNFWQLWRPDAPQPSPSAAAARHQTMPPAHQLALPPGPGSVTDEHVARAERERTDAALEAKPAPAVMRMADLLGLSNSGLAKF